MKMIRCDGCDRIEDCAVNKRTMPEGFAEVSVSISAGPVETNNGTHVRYDLCSACQTKLREVVRVNDWPRAAAGPVWWMINTKKQKQATSDRDADWDEQISTALNAAMEAEHS
jgi:hypothetical protein